MHKPCHNGLPIPTRLQLRNQTLQIFHYRTEFESQRNKVMTCRGLRIAYDTRSYTLSNHDEAKSGTALSTLLSFFHTEIAYDSFTARRESLVGATMVNF
ncbi:unnamed protein product [Brassica napus]|uniref:(rape) hypothetical protein n=1 Tax=Brassica napus TaxID=3708 RepID=A0A816RVF7_BRANA|nr:unnamed protein product [Brassica napus]